MARILLARPMPDSVRAAAAEIAEVEVRESNLPMKPGEMRAALTIYDAVMPTLGDMFTARTFDGLTNPRAKILANFGVGYNHIDVAAARAAGVAVSNTPGAVTDATADIAMTLILMSCRRAGEGERLVRAAQWTGWHPTQMLGLNVTGRTVGIVGMGRIGKAIAKRCHHGFGMQVKFFNRSPVAEPGVPATQVDSLTDLAAGVDILVVAVPGGPETHHLIGPDVLAAMQAHAHLINISRGDVVDEEVLIAALQTGRIAGAGLDVYEFEPQVPPALIALENAVLLPHLGTAALEVREAMGMMALDNIRAVLAGEAAPNAV
ncbi:2-hydroxyacid dehydrogenase [Actibacterium ureilyticum]|uniref:2-hydroxyacid dehydrogenase n=1 Tax=Actibacterium ureilyticum TaxID=1590614 RepID=UPI000BAAE457|nr:D-glycerate dehydrogenase [Actibacterium ureilyticum]